MLRFTTFRSQSDRPTTQRPRLSRRPAMEDLEGRRLLSGVVGNHGVGNVAQVEQLRSDIVGQHIGTSMIQGNHIGMSAGIVGQHIGTKMVQGGHPGTGVSSQHIQGQHIG